MPPRELRGEEVADTIRAALTARIRRLRPAVPTLGTVLMSDDVAASRFMDRKHEVAGRLGIRTRDERLSHGADQAALLATIADLCEDSEVDGVFVQTPLPDHVDLPTVRRAVAPEKDVDAFHPDTLGRLVAGDPRFVPATTAAVCRLLAAYDVPVSGRDVAVVGRSTVIGRPLANRLLWDDEPGNATVTVCHSRTSNLGAHLRQADIVITAAGEAGLVDASMLSEAVVIVDISANRVHRDGEATVVGDVRPAAARSRASAFTPVPGGVGPVTVAALLENTVLAAERRGQSGGADDETT